MKLKICLYGPTGSGKTSIAKYLVEQFNGRLMKIAEPLYGLQDYFFETIGKKIESQDGELLQFFAQKIERENPGWLATEYLQKVNQCPNYLIVNDDCRFNSYYHLKNAGFIFLFVSTTKSNIKLRKRKDNTPIDSNHPTERNFEKFKPDFIIDNNGFIDESFNQIDTIMARFNYRTLSSNKGHFGWLTSKQIVNEIIEKRITIKPFDKKNLNPNSYNYHLNKLIKRINSDVIDCKKADSYETIEIPNEGYTLQPGECYIGSTVEIFGSDSFASLITGRSSIGRKFITNHITAGLIDQGFLGNITLEITVQKPTIVYPEIVFGQIFWFTTFGAPCLYNGKYQNQNGPTCSKLHLDISLKN